MDDDDELWEVERTRRAEALARFHAEAAKEREAATGHVRKALTAYRWWGFTNILNEIRLWFAARRFR